MFFADGITHLDSPVESFESLPDCLDSGEWLALRWVGADEASAVDDEGSDVGWHSGGHVEDFTVALEGQQGEQEPDVPFGLDIGRRGLWTFPRAHGDVGDMAGGDGVEGEAFAQVVGGVESAVRDAGAGLEGFEPCLHGPPFPVPVQHGGGVDGVGFPLCRACGREQQPVQRLRAVGGVGLGGGDGAHRQRFRALPLLPRRQERDLRDPDFQAGGARLSGPRASGGAIRVAERGRWRDKSGVVWQARLSLKFTLPFATRRCSVTASIDLEEFPMTRFTPPPPPPPPLAKLASVLLLAVLATPAGAQTLPEISLRVDTGSYHGVYNESLVSQCNIPSGGMPVEIRASQGAQGVTVNVMAHTVSGYDRFRNLGVPAYLNESGNFQYGVYRQRTAATYTTNSTDWTDLNSFSNNTGSPCFKNDNLITGPSVVRVVLLPGTGYTINPQMRMVELSIRDEPGEQSCNQVTDQDLYMPHPQGGMAWGVCTCAAQSQHPSVRRALDRTIPTPGDDGRYGTDDDGTTPAPAPSEGFLSNLAKQFHDPSHLYCEGSPYRGL